MAKFETVGYIATSKKDAKKFNLCMEDVDGNKHYFLLQAKPTEEEAADNEKKAKLLKMWDEKTPWKKFNVVKVTDE